jgi:preprotein translocase subunit SecE
MGRLKRKRPTSTKKKGRKKAENKTKSEERAVALESGDVAGEAAPGQVEPKPKPLPLKKDVPKAIKPTGRRSELPVWTKATQFLREVKIELKKVTWPSKKDAMASTVVVIILVVIVSAFLGLVDVGLSSLIRIVLH